MAASATYSISTEYRAIDLVSKTINSMSNATNKYQQATKKAFSSASASVSSSSDTIKSWASKISTGFQEAFRNMNLWSRSTGNAFNKATNDAGMFGSVFKAVMSWDVLRTSIRRLKQLLKGAVDDFADFGSKYALATLKFEDINTDTERGKKFFQEYRKEIMKWGDATQYGATKAADAFGKLGGAGYKKEIAFSVLPSTKYLAQGVGMENLADAADMTSSALKAFRLESDDIDTMSRNYTKTTDMLSLAIRRSKMEYTDFGRLIKSTAVVMHDTGGSLSDLLALSIAFGRMGLPEPDINRAILNLQTSILGTDKKINQSMEMLGVKAADASGKLRPLIAIFSDLERARKKFTPEDYNKLLINIIGRGITGQRSLEAIKTAMNEGTKSIYDYKRALESADGEAKKASDLMGDQLKVKLEETKNSAINLGKRFVESFETRGIESLGKLINKINAFDISNIINGTNTTIFIFDKLTGVISYCSDALKFFITVGLIYIGLTKLWAIAGAIQFWISLITMIRSATDAMIVFNWVTGLNPWLVAASVLVAAVLLVWKYWDKIKSAMGSVWNWIQKINPFSDAVDKNLTGKVETVSVNKSIVEEQAAKKSVEDQLLDKFKEDIKVHNINFFGKLDINGAPKGSTFTGNTMGAPDVSVNMLGENS